MGLAIALVSFADALLLRPLPVARPSEIVRVFTASPRHSLGYVSYPDYEDFTRGARMLAGIVAQSQVLLAVGGRLAEVPAVRMGLAVTPNYFDLLGVGPEIGRAFHPAESREAVVVLADSFWRDHFTGDPGIIGRAIPISGTPFTIIGVVPPGFGLDRFLHEDFYVPIGVYAAGLLPSAGHPLTDRGRRYLSVYARRAAPLAAVEGELSAIAAGLAREYPDTNREQKVRVLTEFAARQEAEGSVQIVAWGFLALAALSLLIACSTSSGLLLLDSEARAGDTALKIMLGARPLHLLRESLAESLALAAAGASLAMPVAWAVINLSSRFLALPTDLRMSIDPRLDARAAATALACALATALICAAVPWAQCPVSGRVTGSSRVRHAMVVIEVSVAAALVGLGFLLLSGIAATRGIALGYRTDHILLLSFDPSQVRTDETHARAFYRELLRRTGQLPGVRATALAQSVPLGFTGAQERVKIEAAGPAALDYWMNIVTPEYFELMRMPLVAGRDFSPRDGESSPRVAIVNQTLARLWPGGNALGRTIEMDGQRVEIVGIVTTAKYLKPGETPRPFFYLPYAQRYASRMTLHVQTQGPPAAAAPAVLALARELNATQPVGEVRSLDEYFERGALFLAHMGVGITAAAGGCALLLALAGLYSCMASAVSRRDRELGIRRALGATRGDVMRLVLFQGIRLVTAGVAIGLGIALAIGREAGSITAPGGALCLRALILSQALAGAFVTAASLAACLIPVWQAAGCDPAVTLRRP